MPLSPRPPQRPPACQQCRRRKGKCDFKRPCTPCAIRGDENACEYHAYAPQPRSRRSQTIKHADIDRLRSQVDHLQSLLDAYSPSQSHSDLDTAVDSIGEQLNSLVLDRVLVQGSSDDEDVLSGQIRSLFSAPYPSTAIPEPPSSYDLFFPSPPQDIVATLKALFPPHNLALHLLDAFFQFSNRVHGPVDPRVYKPALDAFYVNPDHPLVQDVGFLSSMLSIFAHGLSSIESEDSLLPKLNAPRHSRVSQWLTGALQGISYKMSAPSGSVGIETLRAVGLVAWFCFFFGDDSLVRPAISLNAKALFVACDGYAMHRDPRRLQNVTEDIREDYRRLFWFLTTMDWTMCSVIGRSYSPVSTLPSIDVAMPTFCPERDPSEEMITNIRKHIPIVRVLSNISHALYSGKISLAHYTLLEEEVKNATSDVVPPLDNKISQNERKLDGPTSALFTQRMLISVQTSASYVKLHGPLAIPKQNAPSWVQESRTRRLSLCVSHARKLLALQIQQLQIAKRHKGHSGFPRFHPIYGAMILASLLILCPEIPDREEIIQELEELVPFVKGFKRLSSITLRGAEVIKHVLQQVRQNTSQRSNENDSSNQDHDDEQNDEIMFADPNLLDHIISSFGNQPSTISNLTIPNNIDNTVDTGLESLKAPGLVTTTNEMAGGVDMSFIAEEDFRDFTVPPPVLEFDELFSFPAMSPNLEPNANKGDTSDVPNKFDNGGLPSFYYS